MPLYPVAPGSGARGCAPTPQESDDGREDVDPIAVGSFAGSR